MKGGAALVTGSSRGIGLAAARALAAQGFAVALNGLPGDPELAAAEASVSACGVPVASIAADVSDIADHARLLDEAEARIGPITTLVNNAGVGVISRGDPLDVTPESFDRCMAVNARAQFFLAQAWAKRVLARERGPHFHSLINVTSSNAVAVAVARGEYCASKAAASMITKVFAVRLGRENICVYDIQPGLIETAMTAAVSDLYQRRIADEGLTLLPRMGQPDDVGRVIATLATGALPYTTGHVVSVDAGMLVSRF
ncbi:MAG: 3-ketoacyl-ACP reductase [Mesorhizobium amorphae]|nr:MAG: 3-ketoacyl-ACP reductase [Mesorhizobium amorphae]